MRVTTGVEIGRTTRRTGVWPRPTVGLADRMTTNDSGRHKSVHRRDAPTPASGFDARRRLAGDYDHVHFQFQFERMAQDSPPRAGGDAT